MAVNGTSGVRGGKGACRGLAAGTCAVVLLVSLADPAWAQRPGRGDGPPPALVQVDAVREEPVVHSVPVIGRLVPRQAGVIAARIGGAVDEMRASVGDRVSRGDVLAVLAKERLAAERDSAEAVVRQRRAMVDAAQAELTKKQQELRRLEGIRTSAAFSQARFEDVTQDVAMQSGEYAERQAHLNQALAQLERAALDLTDSEIRAPFDGVVSEKHTEVGAYVNVGNPIVTLINDGDLEIEAEVPADRLHGMEIGTVVPFELDDGSQHSAIVRAVVPDENARTRTRPVRFTPAFEDLVRPLAANQSLTVAIPVGGAEISATVDKDAVVRRPNGTIVFVVVDGVGQIRPVQLGQAVGGRFVVLSGLNVGDQVVTRGNETLRPGQPVRVAGDSPPEGGQRGGPGARPPGGRGANGRTGPPQTAERPQASGS